MKSYKKYSNWLDSFEQTELLVDDKYFKTDGSVARKVDKQNKFKHYFGDTTVFELDENTKSKIARIISILYKQLPECFCERIHSYTIHMTLHDLSSAEKIEDVKAEVEENEKRIRELLKTNPIFPQTIRMTTNNIYNSCHISLVMGLKPADRYEYEKLLKIYELFDKVRDLKRPLVPHITLGYYNQYGFDEDLVRKLKKLVKELNQQSFEVVLDTQKLVYQTFTSMNDYRTVLKLTDL